MLAAPGQPQLTQAATPGHLSASNTTLRTTTTTTPGQQYEMVGKRKSRVGNNFRMVGFLAVGAMLFMSCALGGISRTASPITSAARPTPRVVVPASLAQRSRAQTIKYSSSRDSDGPARLPPLAPSPSATSAGRADQTHAGTRVINPGSQEGRASARNGARTLTRNQRNAARESSLPASLSPSALTPVSNPNVVPHDGLAELDTIAVVVIGGANRTEYAKAAHDTWLKMFSKRMYVTDVDQADDLGPELADITVNVFEGYVTEDEQVAKFIHPKNPFLKHRGRQRKGNTHGTGWQLAQPRYLLGLNALVERYPDAEWYFVADSDTFVFPRRLMRGLLKQYPPRERSLALGARWERRAGPKMEVCTFGGAGTAISAAAVSAADIPECVRLQDEDPHWNKLGSDWRVAKCLTRKDVEIKAADFMWMVTNIFDCGAHGPEDCDPFYRRIHRTQTECPLTLHYMAPAATRSVFAETPSDTVSLPDDHGNCNCGPALLTAR